MKKILMFLALTIFTILGISGALASFGFDSSDINVDHNKVVSSSFLLNNTDLIEGITNISCTISVENWTTSVSCPSTLNANTSQTISFTVAVPQYISSRTYIATISTQGTLSGNPISGSQTFNINVKKTLDLSLNFIEEIEEIYQDEKDNITLRIKNIGNVPIDTNFTIETNIDNDSIEIPSQISTLSPSEYSDIMLELSLSKDDKIGPKSITFKVTGNNNTNTIDKEIEDSFEILYPLCDVRESGDISIYSILNDEDLEDRDFLPLDTFDVELKIRNDNDDDRKYAKINAVLVYENEKVDDTEFEDKIRVEESDTIETEFTMKIPADVEEGTYYLYISAYDYDDEDNCEQRKIRLNIEKRSNEVIPYNIKLEPVEVECNEEFTLTGNVINLGKRDEEKVKLIYKDNLGNEDTKVFNDLDEGDESSLFSFKFKIPENGEEGRHKTTLNIYYDYNENQDEYEEVKSFEYYVDVKGNCKMTGEFSTTSPITGFAGKNLYATVIIENTGIDSDFKVTAEGSWAEILSIEPSDFNLKEGDTKTIIIQLKPNKGTSEGLHDLDIEIKSGEKTEEKTVSVYVHKQESISEGFLDNFKSSTKETWFFITIVAILIIITVSAVIYFLTKGSTPNVIKEMSK